MIIWNSVGFHSCRVMPQDVDLALPHPRPCLCAESAQQAPVPTDLLGSSPLRTVSSAHRSCGASVSEVVAVSTDGPIGCVSQRLTSGGAFWMVAGGGGAVDSLEIVSWRCCLFKRLLEALGFAVWFPIFYLDTIAVLRCHKSPVASGPWCSLPGTISLVHRLTPSFLIAQFKYRLRGEVFPEHPH